MRSVTYFVVKELHAEGWPKIGICNPIGQELMYFPDFFEVFDQLQLNNLQPVLKSHSYGMYSISVTYNGVIHDFYNSNPADAAANAWIRWKRNAL